MTQRIEVHYVVELGDKHFNQVLEEAKQLGCGFGDAGPLRTVRRYLEGNGIDGLEMLIQDPAGLGKYIEQKIDPA